MLTRLSIHNYALIRDLQVDFEQGFNIITGETGAGKSVLLGALGLILGNRADSQIFKDSTGKCFVEGTFRIDNYGLESFFLKNDIDFEPLTLLRREVTSSGKSRAFINDTPVNLNLLRELGLFLIDIHSQHQNLNLSDHFFQLRIIDSVAATSDDLLRYGERLKIYRETEQSLRDTKVRAEKAKSDLDYYLFQFNQLDEARLVENEQEELEQELEMLSHAEEIKKILSEVLLSLDGDLHSSVNLIRDGSKRLTRIKDYVMAAGPLSARLESCYIELKDIVDEITLLEEKIESDPGRISYLNERLALIYNLEQKHHAGTVAELIGLRNSFAIKISEVEGFDHEIERLENLLENRLMELTTEAELLTHKRKAVFKQAETKVISVLQQLGIPSARFLIRHALTENFSLTGRDQVEFLFSANKDVEPGEISKIASGGEMSRLMLAIKTLVAGSRMIPAIVFDEIDSGISGETAFKMAAILKDLSSSVQVVNITHLPQIAGKGDVHLLVYKVEDQNGTSIFIKKLTDQERIEEIAKMVSGDQVTDSSIDTAKELLSRPV